MQDMFLEGGCKSPKVLRVHLNENGEFQEGSGEDSFSDEEFVEWSCLNIAPIYASSNSVYLISSKQKIEVKSTTDVRVNIIYNK